MAVIHMLCVGIGKTLSPIVFGISESVYNTPLQLAVALSLILHIYTCSHLYHMPIYSDNTSDD